MYSTLRASAGLVLWALYVFQVPGNDLRYADDVFALKIGAQPGRESSLENVAHLLQTELGAQVLPNAAASKLGLILFKAPSPAGQRTFSTRLKRWLTAHKPMVQVPVVTGSGGYAVPTGNVIVEFKDGVAAEDAGAKLGRLGLKIVNPPTGFRPRRFVVQSVSQEPGDGPFAVAKKLEADPDVKFAEPDLLNIFRSRNLVPPQR